MRAGGRGRYRDGTVDCRGASAGFAMGEPYARSHTVPVGHAVRLRILRGMRMHDESDDRRYFSSRRRCEVRSHVRCHRHVADCGAGRAVGRVKYSPSGTVTEGTTVTIEVSRGKQVTKATVPNVIGMTESLANQSIEAAGLKVSVKYETSSKASYGTVTSQTPYSGGDTVESGTTITIYVSHYTSSTTSTTASGSGSSNSNSNNNSNGNSNSNSNNSGSNTSGNSSGSNTSSGNGSSNTGTGNTSN